MRDAEGHRDGAALLCPRVTLPSSRLRPVDMPNAFLEQLPPTWHLKAKKKMASDEGVKSSNNSPVAPSPDDSRGQGQWEDACWQPSISFGLALVASAVVLFFSVARPESQVCTPRAGACSFA